ncbi:hypothetical protein [Haloglycomyces albus]|uniref:hypothetical protein n=1 Tax=Haloglycomyces albus TaxID=526067 RepID=UPI00046C937A|nr:hypothetical protein [Haloglycomyces albus]
MIYLMARFGLGFGMLLIILGGLSACYHPTGTAEFTLSVMNIGLGVFLSAISTVTILIERKRQ